MTKVRTAPPPPPPPSAENTLRLFLVHFRPRLLLGPRGGEAKGRLRDIPYSRLFGLSLPRFGLSLLGSDSTQFARHSPWSFSESLRRMCAALFSPSTKVEFALRFDHYAPRRKEKLPILLALQERLISGRALWWFLPISSTSTAFAGSTNSGDVLFPKRALPSPPPPQVSRGENASLSSSPCFFLVIELNEAIATVPPLLARTLRAGQPSPDGAKRGRRRRCLLLL